MDPGDVLFHSLSTPHGSRANVSGTMRRVFYLHYLAEEVFDDAYSHEAWAAEKPGLTDSRHGVIEQMIRVREQMGLESPSHGGTLRWTEAGFAGSETPVSPQRIWGKLAARIPLATRASLKILSGSGLETITLIETVLRELRTSQLSSNTG